MTWTSIAFRLILPSGKMMRTFCGISSGFMLFYLFLFLFFLILVIFIFRIRVALMVKHIVGLSVNLAWQRNLKISAEWNWVLWFWSLSRILQFERFLSWHEFAFKWAEMILPSAMFDLHIRQVISSELASNELVQLMDCPNVFVGFVKWNAQGHMHKLNLFIKNFVRLKCWSQSPKPNNYC